MKTVFATPDTIALAATVEQSVATVYPDTLLVRTALSDKRFSILEQLRSVRPYKAVPHARRHSRRHPQLMLDAAAVITPYVQSNRIGVILELLGERVRQPRKLAYVHPNCQVRTLRIRRAHVERLTSSVWPPGLSNLGAGYMISPKRSVRCLR